MKKYHYVIILIMLCCVLQVAYGQSNGYLKPCVNISLDEAHIGDSIIDIQLLESYGNTTYPIRTFFRYARVFFNDIDADFMDIKLLKTAHKYSLKLFGGPMLGKLNANGVSIWLRPASKEPLFIKVSKADSNEEKLWHKKVNEPGKEICIEINGLTSNSDYNYAVYAKNKKLAEGKFKTAPHPGEKSVFRVQFGSCFHKIGVHNPNLINQMLRRKPNAVMFLGDIAVDDRENKINLHRSDYLLRDLSKPWQMLAANVPLYTSWDDHDYFNNDLNGIPEGFTLDDREALRNVWLQNWNNPAPEGDGVYFSHRMGPVELFMLDTRSCRINEKRGEYGSFLGLQQLHWLKDKLLKSTAPFKIISSGTMWSDYISNGKDSWGTWDIQAREEIFNFIEQNNMKGVLLISGDRHGARGFTIPRPSGFKLYEFEVASLGGVPGPNAFSDFREYQLFGYSGAEIVAFGEFCFDFSFENPKVLFRLIDEKGRVLEEHNIPYNQL